MPRVVWVTGAKGLIGNYIVRAAPDLAPEWTVRALTREQLDLGDFDAVSGAFSSERPELVIHCAALSQSPVCQAQPALAWKINFQATAHLCELARNSRFIFFSTDLVFDGQEGNYAEAASVHPLSVYAETKVAAEQRVLANPNHTVVRTSLNSGISLAGDRSFNEQLRSVWQRGEKTRLFTDEFRSPIAASVTARAVWEVVDQGLCGIFHLAGAERLSRYQMGQLLARRYPQLHPRIEPGSLKDYAGAPRPPDTSLNCSKLQKFLSFPLPRFGEWCKSCPDEV